MEWRDITLDLLAQSKGDDCTFSRSRPLKKGERIDAFVSHSWHDNHEDKYEQLKKFAEEFERTHEGRSPTFWLDKTCLEQSCISDSLRMLPVNVMACDAILVCHGPTYTRRLWCVLELFCVFAFASDARTAAGRVVVQCNCNHPGRVEGGKSNLSSSSNFSLGGSSKEDVASQLQCFEARHAHCFDPNEEAKLRQVIAATGEEQFNNHIRELGAQLIGF